MGLRGLRRCGEASFNRRIYPPRKRKYEGPVRAPHFYPRKASSSVIAVTLVNRGGTRKPQFHVASSATSAAKADFF
jgi:hypothetical protein